MIQLLNSLKSGLRRTRDHLTNSLKSLIPGKKGLSEDLLEEIEQVLILGDIGVNTAADITDEIKQRFQKEKEVTYEQVVGVIKEEIHGKIDCLAYNDNGTSSESPYVILVVGVNGTGKTTSIGKLAHYYSSEGKRVLLAAADTYRAAAIDQLEKWKDRTGVEIVKNEEGTDPAAVAFDSAQAALARDIDVLLVDTAGRMHTNVNLMQELEKVKRVVGKVIPGAPHKILLVIDANMGQNSISQARSFTGSLDVDSIFLTKLDGTAKGGVVIPIMRELKIPIEFVGIGEQKEDIKLFNLDEYLDALLPKTG